jgi:hypothetical protein
MTYSYHSTRVVIDIATGAIEERDRVPYDGPGAECKKDKGREQERSIYLQQQAALTPPPLNQLFR